jgi:tetratricopeptide (TPR) repeat protein
VTRLVFSALVAVASQWPTTPAQPLPPKPIVSHNITVLRDWVSAVRRHVPGEQDAAVLSLAAWSKEDAQAAWLDVQALVAIAKEPNASAFYVKPSGERIALRSLMPRGDLEAARGLAAQVRLDGVDRFLKRATVLHSDIAYQFQVNAAVAPPESMWSPRRFVVQTEDGQQRSLNGGIVHWEFGRVLLDLMPEVGRDEFARLWYRASLAFKLAVEELDRSHFVRAIEVFPDDAVIRFLKGGLHDAFAHPSVQSVVDSARLPPRVRLEVQSEANELRNAEGEYRRALDADPALAEARLRRGRVLARQGKHSEAAAELRQVLPTLREPLLEYFGRLFLGAEEEALGRFSEARSLYQQAGELYPRAQAPRFALSHLSHRSGSRSAARSALDAAFARSSQMAEDDDPWWTYQRVPGRMANEWREATYRALLR